MIKRALLLLALWPAITLAQTLVESVTVQPAIEPTPVPTVTVTISHIDFERDFAISVPKGLSGRIGFTAKVKDRDRLLVLDLEGRRVTPIVEKPGNNFAGMWSPDGERLVFVSDRDGNKELYSVRWDGSEEVRLTTTPEINEDQPAWHPNGKAVVFIGEKVGTSAVSSNIFALTLATGETKQLTQFDGRNINPRWSPNGATLAFATNRFWPGWRIVLFKPEYGSEEYVSKAEGQVVSQPTFSADGESLYFANNSKGANSIQIMKLTDRAIETARHGSGRHIDPVSSPDNKTVAFAYAEEGASVYSLFLYERGDRTIKSLLSSNHSLRHPTWSGVKAIALEAARFKAVDEDAEALAPTHPSTPAQ